MKSMIKDAAILFAITLISGLLLGVVYEVTKEPIEVQKALRKKEACMEVFQDAADFKMLELSVPETPEAGEKATTNIKTKLTLEAIFKAEKLKVTDEDINTKLAEVAKAYGRQDAEEFVKKATEQLKEYAREELKYDNAVKFIMENAK